MTEGGTMCQIAVNIPENLLYSMCINPLEAEKMVKKAVAYYCYLNMGATFKECAQIAEISEKEFIRYVIDNKDKNPVTLEQGWEAFERLRMQATELPEITLYEINAEINAVRKNMEAE